MKTLLVIGLCVLLLKSGYCEDAEAAEAPKEDPASDTTFKDVTEQDAAPELQTALNENDGTKEKPDVDTQGIHLNFKPGKGLVITLTPEGGVQEGNGVTYTRWGKWSCPQGTKKIYDGYAAGGWYHQKGNGANYLCMPKDPQYLSTTNVPWPSYLYGAEYQSNNQVFGGRTQDYNVPCAVCQAPRINKLMVPGKVSCPPSWKREYYGYLMTSYHNHYQQVLYECVDNVPDLIPGSQANRDGALFYFVQVECSRGLPCGPYIHRRAVTCALCTK